MLSLLHVSDLHFGPPFLPGVGEALRRTAHDLAPDTIVVSGDLTQRAKRGQFAAAKEYVGRLPDVPKLIVPGNHDVPLYRVGERMVAPHKLYREYISPKLDQRLSVDGAIIVGLDSTAPRSAITNGRIRTEQLDYCQQALAEAGEGAARIVVAHHHFAPAPDYEHDQTMRKARRTLERLDDMGVDLILGGHLHRAYIGNSLDLIPGKAPRSHHGIIIVQCGTSTSRRGRARERERNSFNLIRIEPTMIRISHYMYFDDTDGFEPISHHHFPRRGIRLAEE